MNSNCETYDRNSVLEASFDQSSSYTYCQNLPQSGSINLEDFEDGKIDLSHVDPENSTNRVCEWEITLATNYEVDVIMSRNASNFEDLYMEVQTDEGYLVMHSKDFSNCAGESTTKSFSNARSILVKTKVLDGSNSRYTISISQKEATDTGYSIVLLIIIA